MLADIVTIIWVTAVFLVLAFCILAPLAFLIRCATAIIRAITRSHHGR